MQSQITVSQWGDSLAIRLPQDLVSTLAIERGIELELRIEDDGFKVTVPSPHKKFTLDELLAGVMPENCHPEISFDFDRAKVKQAAKTLLKIRKNVTLGSGLTLEELIKEGRPNRGC
jgi:antitoxin MazE